VYISVFLYKSIFFFAIFKYNWMSKTHTVHQYMAWAKVGCVRVLEWCNEDKVVHEQVAAFKHCTLFCYCVWGIFANECMCLTQQWSIKPFVRPMSVGAVPDICLARSCVVSSQDIISIS
jgi:hypothetical protein